MRENARARFIEGAHVNAFAWYAACNKHSPNCPEVSSWLARVGVILAARNQHMTGFTTSPDRNPLPLLLCVRVALLLLFTLVDLIFLSYRRPDERPARILPYLERQGLV